MSYSTLIWILNIGNILIFMRFSYILIYFYILKCLHCIAIMIKLLIYFNKLVSLILTKCPIYKSSKKLKFINTMILYNNFDQNIYKKISIKSLISILVNLSSNLPPLKNNIFFNPIFQNLIHKIYPHSLNLFKNNND